MYVLSGPPSSHDPLLGPWEFVGPIRGALNHWSIDGTVFELDHALYYVYSGWPRDNTNDSDLVQELFIQSLSDPVTASSAPVRISRPELPFEWTDDHGINEGPQFLASQDGSWRGIVYSCAGSWTKDYKENTLAYTGGDPLQPGSWRKGQKPLIQDNGGRKGPFGPGHGCFLHVGNETVHVYHATDREGDGWAGRKARVQRVAFGSAGPDMGGVVGPRVGTFEEFIGGSAGYGHGDGHGSGDHKKHGLKAWLQRVRDEL